MSIILEELTKGVREALPFLTHLVTSPENLSKNEMLRRLSDAGLGINRAQGLKVIGQLQAADRAGVYLREYSAADLPVFGDLAKAVTPLLRNFAYLIRARYYLPSTGETLERFITYSTNTLITKDQALAAIAEETAGLQAASGTIHLGGTVDNVLISPDAVL